MSIRLAIAQLNLLVGDIEGNTQRIIDSAIRLRDQEQADMVVFSELTLIGYPPEDLLLRPACDQRVESALERLRGEVEGITLVLGYPAMRNGERYNVAGVIRDGKTRVEYRKRELPNYSVFDEKRYFSAGDKVAVFEQQGVHFGLAVCEDIWFDAIVRETADAGAQFLLNLNASPFHMGKSGEREGAVMRHGSAAQVGVVYVNQVGGQDELVFDGASFVTNRQGAVIHRVAQFSESESVIELDADGEAAVAHCVPLLDADTEVYRALVTGVRDYVRKNGVSGAVLGLSGGIDSALTLAIAVDALGAEHVEVVMMPSRYTADMSNEDAVKQAETLGVKWRSIAIEPAFNAFLEMLSEEFSGLPADVTEENIQARCRGILLMAISNKSGRMLLTTGNKSEMSVGYATLYGDMAGGFAPLKDVPKQLVFRLSEWRNRDGEVIPRRVIDRPPSAELRPDQKDSDSLPDYAVLDAVIQRYVEQDQSVEDIVAAGFELADVERVTRLIDRSEYKRRQAPPGVKITRRAYGRDRRYPIVSGF